MLKELLPPTTKRVYYHTDPEINSDIREQAIDNLTVYKNSDKLITDRLRMLNKEWDTERFLETNAASVVIISSMLGLKKGKGWFCLTGAAGAFLLQHALQGWCPPLPIIRRLGIRTAEEIYNEKAALKMMRGDFSQDTRDVSKMLAIAEKE